MTEFTPITDSPTVGTTTRGTVVVELRPDQAETLARVLYAYDTINDSAAASYAGAQVVEDYDAEEWNPVALALLGEAATVCVPFLAPGPGLRLGEGTGR